MYLNVPINAKTTIIGNEITFQRFEQAVLNSAIDAYLSTGAFAFSSARQDSMK
jgi:hypothetical protein